MDREIAHFKSGQNTLGATPARDVSFHGFGKKERPEGSGLS